MLPPDDDDLLEADEFYSKVYRDSLSNGVLNEVDYLAMLQDEGLWDSEKENTLNDVLPNHIEQFCIQIFESVFKSETREKTRKYLAKARAEVARLSDQRYIFYHLTCPGIASFARSKFVLERGVFKFDPEYIPDLHALFNFSLSQSLSDETIRYLARKSPWTEMWAVSKKNGTPLFRRTPTSLTPNQQRLILWSSMYDGIRESPDCPDDYVIDDDDALDGWLILQRRKSEGAKIASDAERYITDPKAGEIFVVAESPEDIKRIKKLNNPHGQAVLKSRFKKLKEKGGESATDLDFADVRLGLQSQATQQFLNTRK